MFKERGNEHIKHQDSIFKKEVQKNLSKDLSEDSPKGPSLIQKQENLVVADWWSYDDDTNTLYYEPITDVTDPTNKPVFKQTRTFFFAESDIGEGWIVPSEDENHSIILWKTSELTAGNDLVAEVVKWNLLATHHGEILEGHTYGISVSVIDNKKPWVWEEGLPEVTLRGHYRDGGYFEDPIRLIIPLQSGGMIAIGKSRGRHYFLHTVSVATA